MRRRRSQRAAGLAPSPGARLRFGASGLEGSASGLIHHLLAFADSVLRGVGQVMFLNNSYAGVLFLAGIGLNSLTLALATATGAAVGTLAALALGGDRAQLRAGMYGFNGALVALALLTFLPPSVLTWGAALVASACSTAVMVTASPLLRCWRLPVLTAPFVATTLCALWLSTRVLDLPISNAAPASAAPGAAVATTLIEGLFSGIAQVFFQDSVWSGALFALGLLVASRRACAAALVGSACGLLVAWLMGAAEPALRTGMYGFNSVLVAVALGSVFALPGWASWAYAVAGALAAPFVVAAATAALMPLGIPALTLPFVLVTWVWLLAGQALPGRARRAGAGVAEP